MIEHVNHLLFLGLTTLGGLAAGKLMNKIKLPAVTGYVLIGVILGSSVTGILTPDILEKMDLINGLALGFIAFVIGEELEFNSLRKCGKSIIYISICEALGAFILVTLSTYLMIRKLHLALILGAVASATAPAATLMVLRESKSEGILTTTLMAVVAIDDAMALILYGFSSSIAKVLMVRGSNLSISNMILKPSLEIAGAIILGILSGLVLSFFAKKMKSQNELLILIVGIVLLNSGLAQFCSVSELLSCMFMGITLCNAIPSLTNRIFRLTANVTPPLYVMFFVLAGARLQLGLIKVVGVLGGIYTLARILGKVGGASLGGYLSDAPKQIRNYIGFGLLSQIGVAVGLAIMISYEFPVSIYGEAGVQMAVWVVNILLFTTIITEVIGPILTKYAITKAGEVNKAT